jgi:hypothetical protein
VPESRARIGPLERWPLARLRPASGNPRVHPPEQLARIGRSIEAFGWVNPILAGPDGEILAGEARWRAARELGLEDAPVVVVAGLGALDRRAYRVADNRLAEGAGWDEGKLAALFRDLEAAPVDPAAVGFSEREIAALLATLETTAPGGEDPDRVPAVPDAPVTEPGDVWELGPHRLVCGDSTRPETYGALMGGRLATMSVADLIFTDPPYGMSYKGGRHDVILGDRARGDDLRELVAAALTQAVGPTPARRPRSMSA